MRTVLLCTAAVLALAPAARAADAVWQHDGPIDPRSPGTLTCAGGGETVTPAVGAAEITDHGEDITAGGAGSVRVGLSLTGPDGCAAAGGTRAQVEVVPPPRTALLIHHDYGVDCGPAAALVGCRAAYRTGAYGGLIVDDARGATPQPWAVSGDATQPTYVSVPLVYNGSIDTFNKSTERRCGAVGVCAPSAAGGRVQVVVTFLAGGTGAPAAAPVLTTVGVLPGGDDECCGDIEPDPDTRPRWFEQDRLPTKVTRGDLRRGYRFAVHLTKGAKLTVTLTQGSSTVATAARTGRSDDVVETVLKLGPKALRRLGSSATLTLRRTGGTTSLLSLRAPVKVTGR